MDNSQDKKTYCIAMSSPSEEGSSKLSHMQISYKLISELFHHQRSQKIHLNRPNTNFYQSTFEYMGAQAYNSLPREIRNIISIHTFKRVLNPLTLMS